ncbi:MAG TPA: hypothetical protein VGO67_03060 [Verrucomicrobiae bacterium]|jgi:hypothetical protein
MSQEEILVRLGLDNRALQQGLQAADKSVEEFGHRAKETLADTFKELTAPILGTGAIAMGVEKIFGKVEEIERVAAATGFAAEEYQRLVYAAKSFGIESSAVEKSLETLAKNIGQANEGETQALELFNKWGIALKDARGDTLEVNDVFKEIVDKVSSMHDPAARTAADMDLLGKNGAKFVALMVQGNEAIQEIGKSASVVTTKEIEDLKEAKEWWESAGNFATVWGAKIGAGIVDSVKSEVLDATPMEAAERGNKERDKATKDRIDKITSRAVPGATPDIPQPRNIGTFDWMKPHAEHAAQQTQHLQDISKKLDKLDGVIGPDGMKIDPSLGP